MSPGAKAGAAPWPRQPSPGLQLGSRLQAQVSLFRRVLYPERASQVSHAHSSANKPCQPWKGPTGEVGGKALLCPCGRGSCGPSWGEPRARLGLSLWCPALPHAHVGPRGCTWWSRGPARGVRPAQVGRPAMGMGGRAVRTPPPRARRWVGTPVADEVQRAQPLVRGPRRVLGGAGIRACSRGPLRGASCPGPGSEGEVPMEPDAGAGGGAGPRGAVFPTQTTGRWSNFIFISYFYFPVGSF